MAMTLREIERRRYLKHREKRIAKNCAYRRAHAKETLVYKRKLYRDNPSVGLLYLCRARAKRKGIPFSISIEDVNIPDVCPVLGIPISVGDGKHHDGSPTIDRIDNDRGYVKDNVMVISFRANSLKRNASLDEMKKLYEFYSALKGIR